MKRRPSWITRYTALYCFVMLPLALCLLVSGKTLLWGNDAYYQQYPVLYYAGQCVRSIFAGEGLPMMEFSLGQGMDALGTLSYYGLTDPFQWFAALFTGRALEVYYHVLIFLYIYLSGLFFALLVKKLRLISKEQPWLLAISALLFAFCGYQTIGVIKNPYYASGSMYLCLMLIATERIFEKRKWCMMSLVTLLMLISNFYLAYQTTLLVIVYILVRMLSRWKTRGLKGSAADGFTLLGAYALGLALSAAVLLPVAASFLSSSRVNVASGYTASLLHYPPSYYVKLAMLLCAPYDYAGYWALQSFCPLVIPGLLMLFSRKKVPLQTKQARSQHRQLLILFLIALVFLCVPLAGRFFNGMGYATNRWSYGYAVIVCCIAAWGLPHLMDERFAYRKRISIIMLVYGALMLVYGAFAHKFPVMNGAGNAIAVDEVGIYAKNLAGLAGGAAVIAAGLCLLWLDKFIKRKHKHATRLLAFMVALCSLAYTAGYGIVAASANAFAPKNVDRKVHSEVAAAADSILDDAFYRIDAGASTDDLALMLDYRGSSYYWSMIPAWVSQHYTSLELSTQRWTFRNEGTGADPYIGALACDKYSLRKDKENMDVLPYGCTFMEESEVANGDTIKLYRNDLALPLGYLFTEQLSEADYAALNPLQKRETLVSCAVVEDTKRTALPLCTTDFPYETIDWKLLACENASFEDNSIHGTKGSLFTLGFEPAHDSELYLRVVSPHVIKKNQDTDMLLTGLGAAGTNRMYMIRQDGVFNFPQTGSTMYLGHSQDALTQCTLKFRAESTLEFKRIELLSAPSSFLRDAIAKLKQNSWSPKVEKDRIHGSINTDADGILQLALPYSSGWRASVDGKDAELFRCGGMYMGLEIKSGAHELELSYETPMLKTGAIISLGALALMITLGIMCAIKRRKR